MCVLVVSFSVGVRRSRRYLPAPLVLVPFDPRDDRDRQLFAGGPGLCVEKVGLEQGEN